MKLYNYLVVAIYNYYADIKMAYTKRVESGAISLEWSLVGGVLIAIAVYVEHGVWGASYAAPIAGLMIEKYLKDGEIHPSKNWIEERMLNANLIDVP